MYNNIKNVMYDSSIEIEFEDIKLVKWVSIDVIIEVNVSCWGDSSVVKINERNVFDFVLWCNIPLSLSSRK